VGSGSEHYGYDDEISRDHDFEPGFCIFLPGEELVSRRQAFLLERAYAKLPKEYMGFKRLPIAPVGGNRNGVMRISDFYLEHIGSEDGELTNDAWLKISDQALFESTSGKIFFDNLGEFTGIREKLLNMPKDIMLKRLAGNLLIMAQSGQYNYARCINHGELEASQLAVNEFVSSAMKAVFILNNKYMPYYKWSFRALRELPDSEKFQSAFSELLLGNSRDELISQRKYDIIETVCTEVIELLKTRGYTKAICGDMEKHAYSVNDMISDGELRNMHILAAI